MKQFDATKPKYNQLFKAATIFTNFTYIGIGKVSLMMLWANNLSQHMIMVGREIFDQVQLAYGHFIHGLEPVRALARFMSFKPSLQPHHMNFFGLNLVG